jgi:hypothetical protein
MDKWHPFPLNAEKKGDYIVRLLMYAGLWSMIACAAMPVAAQNPAPDDPAVLLGYFSLHQAINQAAAQDPSLRHAAASMVGISDSDFAVITRIADSVISDVRSITNEASSRPVDRLAARQVQVQTGRRVAAALVSGLSAVRQQLSPNSWAALHKYINGPYRANLRSYRVPAQ